MSARKFRCGDHSHQSAVAQLALDLPAPVLEIIAALFVRHARNNTEKDNVSAAAGCGLRLYIHNPGFVRLCQVHPCWHLALQDYATRYEPFTPPCITLPFHTILESLVDLARLPRDTHTHTHPHTTLAIKDRLVSNLLYTREAPRRPPGLQSWRPQVRTASIIVISDQPTQQSLCPCAETRSWPRASYPRPCTRRSSLRPRGLSTTATCHQPPASDRDVAGARNNFFAAYGQAIGMGYDGVSSA